MNPEHFNLFLSVPILTLALIILQVLYVRFKVPKDTKKKEEVCFKKNKKRIGRQRI